MRRTRPECVGSEPVLENSWITVRRNSYRLDVSPEPIDYYVTDTAEIALVVPITPRGRFVMVEQWKLPIERRSLEFPAGAIGAGSPLANAKRELLEETGRAAASWRKLGVVFPDTGRSRNRIHLFLAERVRRVADPTLEAVEAACGLRTTEVRRREVREFVGQGRIKSAGSLAALALLTAS